MVPSRRPGQQGVHLSRLKQYKSNRFTSEPPANSTGVGQYHIDLAALLHDKLFGEYWARLGRTTLFPVGKGNVSIQRSGAVIPELVPANQGAQTPNVPPAIDRRDLPPNQEGVRVYWKNVGARWQITHPEINDGKPMGGFTESGMNSISKQLGIPTARQEQAALEAAPPAVQPPPPPPVVTKPPEQVMDLGQILNTGLDLYGRYQQIQTLQQPVSVTPAYNNPLVPDIIEQYVPGFTADGEPVLMPAKKPCKRRRRRRRLATKSDLGDLAALKAILGNGEAFKAWIATHSR